MGVLFELVVPDGSGLSISPDNVLCGTVSELDAEIGTSRVAVTAEVVVNGPATVSSVRS